MKVNAIMGRGTRKDFVDLYVLLQHYSLAEILDFYMQKRVHGKLKTGAILFSNVYGILGETAGAEELLKLHQKNI